jgi:hypothetical protein
LDSIQREAVPGTRIKGGVLMKNKAGSLKRMAKERKSDIDDEHLQGVPRICAAMPETTERLSHGEPTFFVRKKVFANVCEQPPQ